MPDPQRTVSRRGAPPHDRKVVFNLRGASEKSLDEVRIGWSQRFIIQCDCWRAIAQSKQGARSMLACHHDEYFFRTIQLLTESVSSSSPFASAQDGSVQTRRISSLPVGRRTGHRTDDAVYICKGDPQLSANLCSDRVGDTSISCLCSVQAGSSAGRPLLQAFREQVG